jgi:hypothetical protein
MTVRPGSVARLLLPVAVATLFGCGGGGGPETAASAEAAENPVRVTVKAENLPAVRTTLALADRLDGVEDGVVHRCAGCALGMDGSADHAVVAAGHTLHFCSDGCRKRFVARAEPALLALEVPGS